MAPKTSRQATNVQHSPIVSVKDPSLSSSLPTTSKGKNLDRIGIEKEPKVSFRKRCCKYLYNRENKTICDRTCTSWLHIITYSILYITFLCTYTLVFLYGSLWVVRLTTDFKHSEPDRLTYTSFGVGLSATPTGLSHQPVIWYRKDYADDYQKYVIALDILLKIRRKRDVSELGPCGVPPYGYGNKPCIILRINKHYQSSVAPLDVNSTEAEMAPVEVQKWLERDKKLWLHCGGYHLYDKEHIGRIQYFPHPPGFEPSLLRMAIESPLVAIQISDFTLGVSLAIECKLWHANGPSSIGFVLYVSDDPVSNTTRF